MSTTMRESMRREFRELAKLAETMGKPSADASLASEASGPEFPRDTLERPVTPASASRVSVPPVSTPMTPPLYDLGESKKGSRKRTGLIVMFAGTALAAAVVGGVMVGKSLGGGSTASAAPVDVRGAAAVAAPPAVTALPSAVAPAAQAPTDPSANSPSVAVAVKAAPPAAAVAPAAAPVHKHIARPVTASTSGFTPKAASASNAAAATGNDAVAASKPTATPAFAKPAAAKPAAASGGGGDSLEDLIRKEVAAQKK